jgi:hypothetical protein
MNGLDQRGVVWTTEKSGRLIPLAPAPPTYGDELAIGARLEPATDQDADRAGSNGISLKSGKLYMIAYVGAKIYYFDRHLSTVEQMFQSIQML